MITMKVLSYFESVKITEKCFYFSLGMHTVPNFYFGLKNSSLLEDREDVFFKIKNYIL